MWFPIVSLSPSSGTLILLSVNSEGFGIIHRTVILPPALVLPLLTQRKSRPWRQESGKLASQAHLHLYGPRFCSSLNKRIQPEDSCSFLGEERRNNV